MKINSLPSFPLGFHVDRRTHTLTHTEKERKRERERKTDRQTDRDRHTHSHTHTLRGPLIRRWNGSAERGGCKLALRLNVPKCLETDDNASVTATDEDFRLVRTLLWQYRIPHYVYLLTYLLPYLLCRTVGDIRYAASAISCWGFSR